MSKQPGKLIILSGPSGVGQDTVIEKFTVKHPDFWESPSVTTREPRPGEVDGQDMIFVDEPTFRQWQEEGKFLESYKVTDYWYGTLAGPIEEKLGDGTNVIVRPDPKGALDIKKQYPESIAIFLNAESQEALKERIRNRGTESPEEIEHRLATNKEKLTYIDKYDHVVINPTGHPERAVEEIENIIYKA